MLGLEWQANLPIENAAAESWNRHCTKRMFIHTVGYSDEHRDTEVFMLGNTQKCLI